MTTIDPDFLTDINDAKKRVVNCLSRAWTFLGPHLLTSPESPSVQQTAKILSIVREWTNLPAHEAIDEVAWAGTPKSLSILVGGEQLTLAVAELEMAVNEWEAALSFAADELTEGETNDGY